MLRGIYAWWFSPDPHTGTAPRVCQNGQQIKDPKEIEINKPTLKTGKRLLSQGPGAKRPGLQQAYVQSHSYQVQI